MVRFKAPKQGQILWTNLNPTQGHEQQGRCPVLVVSNDDFNELCGGMVKVASITGTMRSFPLHIPVPEGLPIHGMVKLEQERSIDLSYRGYELACDTPQAFMNEVLKIISRTY
ncbi:type II toxin-antitoxin system PemK/MazF family toxin [Limosilactobacillus sp.]|uniref:type II toxin-antitoxin system PemK/MazF family toxin n=1 Tax=Limosilactobacillus sp. TaxID=2773925 RepID=UPI00345E0937